MTKVKMIFDNNLYCGFEMEGHAEYNLDGPDVICACLSATSQMTINGILCATGLDYNGVVKSCNPANAKLKMVVPLDYMSGMTMGPIVQALFTSFHLYVSMLADLYPENVKVEEEWKGEIANECRN